jgi:hypothetical protein
LIKLVTKYPDVEGEVIWAENDTWRAQEDEASMLDGEEIPYYAEGLLQEGYGFAWQAMGEQTPELIRLFFWLGVAPTLPTDQGIVATGCYNPLHMAAPDQI